MDRWITVASVESFDTKPLQTMEYEGRSIAVIRIDDAYYAVDNICTHDDELMEEEDLEGDELVCPRHGARFCVRTGKVTAPPAFEDLTTYPTKTEDGVVKVCLDDSD
ncbi:MAG: non-heme iron oxygenase ferredoxin subunit [Gammaproteobacteria bacterium]